MTIVESSILLTPITMMYISLLKKYIYITENSLYESLITSLKLANSILKKEEKYINNKFINIYEKRKNIFIITCGKKLFLFKKIIENYTFFTKFRNINDDIISKEHFFFLKNQKKKKKKKVFIFLCVENFNKNFKNKIINILDKGFKNYVFFIGKKKPENSRLFSRCLNLSFNKVVSDNKYYIKESIIEKKIRNMINNKDKSYIFNLSNNYNIKTIVFYLDKFIKNEIFLGKNEKKMFNLLKYINLVYKKNEFMKKEKILYFLAEFFALNE
ncbi:hypothetical protein ACWNX6_00375 [Candidatus Vidania fulgoroideorum]